MMSENDVRKEIRDRTEEKERLQHVIKTSRDGRLVVDSRDRMEFVINRLKFLNGKLQEFQLSRGINRTF